MELKEALDKLSAAGMIAEGCCSDKDKKNCDGKCSCGKEGCKGECGKDKKKKKKKEIEEALDILAQSGLVAESYWSGSRPETRYGNRTGVAGYTFRGAKPERKYVKILICLRDGEKTKAEVHRELGMPDPTSKEHENYYSSVWQEMRKAGLVDFEKTGGKTIWFITPRGMDLLDEIGATEN